MKLKRDTKFGEESTCCFKIDKGIWQILTWSLESLNNLCFNWLLVTKVYIIWATKLQSSFLSWHWNCKFWRKSDLWFEKRLEKFDKFSPDHLKESKLGFWCDPFVQSRKGMTLKFTEKFYVMAMKNNAKLEEELTCHFKTDLKNLTNVDSI